MFQIYDHFQIKLALCFKDLLPGPALKDSLAKVRGDTLDYHLKPPGPHSID